ncbi:hypothetical protein V5O48_002173 [Marasmius crinis-equi]|uniref:Uncharacterized protein n=1 Tax=Marasmius crinis-equi TaxID=585013 RepID=A0ABR3FWB7_9AGAR
MVAIRTLTLSSDAETVFPLFAQSSITFTLTTLHLYGDLKGRVKNLSVQAGNILDFIGHFAVLKELSMCYEIQRYIRNAVKPTDGPGSKKATLRFLHTLDLNLPWSIFMLWFLIPGVLRFPSVEKLQIDSEWSTEDRTIPLNLQAYLELFSSLKDLTILLHNWMTCQRLLDIVESTREEKGEGEPEPLKVIVTVPSNTADVPEIEGITWILQFGAI